MFDEEVANNFLQKQRFDSYCESIWSAGTGIYSNCQKYWEFINLKTAAKLLNYNRYADYKYVFR